MYYNNNNNNNNNVNNINNNLVKWGYLIHDMVRKTTENYKAMYSKYSNCNCFCDSNRLKKWQSWRPWANLFISK
jgi:hypothetical protein